MAKSKLVLKMQIKWWAKPMLFFLVLLGLGQYIQGWMFNIEVGAE